MIENVRVVSPTVVMSVGVWTSRLLSRVTVRAMLHPSDEVSIDPCFHLRRFMGREGWSRSKVDRSFIRAGTLLC